MNMATSRNGDTVVELKRHIGLFNGVTIIVGMIIGSGIFISPKGVLLNSGGSVGVAMLVWTLCGVMSVCGALGYAELGASMLKSGGDYAYLYEAFGPIPAFLRLWTLFLMIRPGVVAVLCLTSARYALQPFFLSCDPPEAAIRCLAAAMILLLTFVNCYSVRLSTWIQDVFSVGKVLALLVIIIAGVVQMAKGTENFQNAFDTTDLTPVGIPLAFYSGLFAFAGWFGLNTLTEEIKNPERNLPLAIIIAILLVMVVYLLTNVAYLTVMTSQEVLASGAVAITFADRVLGVMSWIIPVSVSVSCFSCVNGVILSCSRVVIAIWKSRIRNILIAMSVQEVAYHQEVEDFAIISDYLVVFRVTFVGARDGYLPDLLAMIHVKLLTPLPAVALICPLSLLMLSTSDVYRLINFLSCPRWLFIGLTTAAVPYLRWKRPGMRRPLKASRYNLQGDVPLVFPVTFALACAVVVAMSLYSAPVDVGIGLALTLTGVPVYCLAVWNNKPGWLIKFTGNFCDQDSTEDPVSRTSDEQEGLRRRGEQVIGSKSRSSEYM
ncbi:SLC7A11 [Branchiostoma lanceolatum]|uniref:SLC7A11 protein n=1 Tax=Branchiostoma lanceolatum TaxID=7740 RepID=A0A8K0ECX5_BRALA|nr:SLC7A11 [Branchiostoma lanceolatum]